VNLAGEVEGLARGEVLTRPGTLRATSMVDAVVSLLPDARPLADGARVRVHVASAEVLARVRLLGPDSLEPGTSELAQLRLERPAVAGRGDRLVLRSYSPPDTIAGAVVVDPVPPRRSTSDRPAVERLRDASDLLAAAEAMVAEAASSGIAAPLLAARLTVPLARLSAEVPASASMVALGPDPAVVLSRGALARMGEEALVALEAFHEGSPLKVAMPREELRGRVFGAAPAIAFEQVLADLAAAGRVRLLPDAVAAARHEVRLSAGEEEARTLLLETALAAGLSGVELPALAERSKRDARLLERVARVLTTERVLGRVGEGLLVHRDRLEALKLQVRERWPAGSKIEVGAFKDLTGLSRKYVIPLLEYLDRERVTRRAGNDRIVL
jgi:selenocysteine-specific elongation factor